MKKLLLFAILFSFFCSIQAQYYNSIYKLTERRAPWLRSHLILSTIPSENGKDVFEIKTKNGKVCLAASNANSAAFGLNWYLKYYCHRSMSHLGDNLSSPGRLPQVKEKIHKVCLFPVRYALNYCTISYSMSFYSWSDWERELDWMALNGVNLMLAPVGIEAVWQNTLLKLGYSQKETLDFIAGPAFGAWWLMGNLEGWGGPVSQTMINCQVVLQKKILSRMQELGIQPEMHGFYGMIPTTLKNKMSLQVIDQGKWAGGFQRPDFLIPTDSHFSNIADIYYTEMKKLYGTNLHFFGGDPFHEGGSSKGADVSASATEIQKAMQRTFPGSTWVLQGWQTNPSTQLLNGLDKNKTLVVELFGENTANWEERKGYEGTSFVWSNVSNFGEKTGIYGKLQRFADEVYRAKQSQYGSFLKGTGIIPEGINNNPVAYDLMFELAWHGEHLDVSQWIKSYILYRYGKTSLEMETAWELLLKTAYSSPEVYQEGPSESIFCARPAVDIQTVSSWGTRKRNYDVAVYEKAVRAFAAAARDFRGSQTYETDRVDFVRQMLANKADMVYLAMVEAIKQKDKKTFVAASNHFQQMIMLQDSLLSSNKHFSLNNWLQQAVNFGTTPADKQLSLWNAKAQVSYWGPDTNPDTNLRDYAHKEWSGLLSSLYLARWKKFTADELAKMDGKTPDSKSYFELEKQWSLSPKMYVSKPLSLSERNAVIEKIISQE
jgi:alpha-N-acetylglucosaminidase